MSWWIQECDRFELVERRVLVLWDCPGKSRVLLIQGVAKCPEIVPEWDPHLELFLHSDTVTLYTVN